MHGPGVPCPYGKALPGVFSPGVLHRQRPRRAGEYNGAPVNNPTATSGSGDHSRVVCELGLLPTAGWSMKQSVKSRPEKG